MHWLATATALSAVVAAASFIQPPDATATPGPDPQTAPRAAAAAPDPRKVDFPVDCGPNRVDVLKKASGDLDGNGSPETVAAVRCHSGFGTPPSGVYVLAQPSDPKAPPRVVATLLSPSRKTNVQDLTLRGREISSKLLAYSTDDVPRCCPDVRKAVKWQWKGGKFVQSELPADMSTERA